MGRKIDSSLIYALHGYIGVGKTTFAKKLEAEKRADRDNAREVAKTLGAEIVFYNLICSDKIALARNLARSTSDQPLEINENTYRTLKQYFEPMGPDETAILADTSAT